MKANQTTRLDLALSNQQPAIAGVVVYGFEASAFFARGEDLAWWLEGPAARSMYIAFADLRQRGAHQVWMSGRARISEPGRYGHLGGYPHTVGITHVGEVLARRATDCPERGVSVAPLRTDLVIGDTMRIDVAAFDIQGRPIAPHGIVWTSTNPRASAGSTCA
ncbi:MAG: hypothetical protein ACRENP_01440 [Longimicrobiales bacterium]